MTSNLYHYTDSGLDYVYLVDGFKTINDPEFGKLVSIHNLDRLNHFIAKHIIEYIPSIRGQEIRFFRSQFQLSQKEMGKLFGHDERTIQRWESARLDAIPPTADRFLRLFYLAYSTDSKKVESEVFSSLKEAQNVDSQVKDKNKRTVVHHVKLRDTGRNWKKAA